MEVNFLPKRMGAKDFYSFSGTETAIAFTPFFSTGRLMQLLQAIEEATTLLPFAGTSVTSPSDYLIRKVMRVLSMCSGLILKKVKETFF